MVTLNPKTAPAVAVALLAGLLSLAPVATGQPAPPKPAALPAKPAVPALPPLTGKDVQLNYRFEREVKPLLDKHCYSCHGNGKTKGDLSLDKYADVRAIRADKKVWTNVADLIEQQVMPPDNKPQPTDAERKTLLAWIDAAVNTVDCSGPRDPGYVAIHRLNRTEYNNTIRDLIGIDFKPAADFPADDTGYGFDNIADVLTMSPLLAEKYLAAAEAIFDKAITDPRPPKSATIKIAGAQFRGEIGSPHDGSAWNVGTTGQITARHDFPADGEYEIRVIAYQEPFGNEPAKMTLRVDGKDAQTFDVTDLRAKPATFKVRQTLPAGRREIATAFLNNAKDERNPDRKKRGDRNLIVVRAEIEGPFNAKPPQPSESHKRLFFVTPGNGTPDESAARQVITRFATRAFRRPPTPDEIDRLTKLYADAKADGEPFEQACRVALSAVLVSPHFLYRIELDPKTAPPATPRALNDFELASRLSYFLWSTTPDDALLNLAVNNKLKDPATLDAEVKRMLADPKAGEFVRNFVGQWLELRNLSDHTVDARRYPDFNNDLRDAMRRETEMLFEAVLKEDRSLLDLLNADYTFVNEPLAKLYGLKDVKGPAFRKVSLAGTRRAGILTHAAVLTVTAMPTRTSPVKRGVFVLENVLGTPPPPPPPNVPDLADKPKDEASAPLKQRLAQHRADPNCSVCHQRMDGIGFALENFNPIGAWRDADGKFPVDATGEIPGGRKLDGPESLRQLLASRSKDFTRCLTEKLLTYALGRGMKDYDACTVKDIVAQVEKADHRFSALIHGIVKSDAFQKRRSKRDGE